MEKDLDLLTNHKKIIETVRRFGPIPRSEISDHVDLTPGPITRLSRDLLAKGLLREDPRRSGTRGQPALPLSLNPERGHGFGITFRLRHIEIVCCNLVGQVIARQTCKVDTADVVEVTRVASKSVEAILATLNITRSRVLGAGIAAPGFFPDQGNMVQTPTSLETWRDQDIPALFSDALAMPAWIDNVGNCSALAEYFTEKWKKTKNLILVHLGYGVGGGLVLNGQLFRGTTGNAGEIGGMFPYGSPRPSALDLLENTRDAGHQVDNVEGLGAVYEGHDPIVERWVERAVEQLEFPISSATWWLEPEAVVIGGILPPMINQRIAEKLIQMNLFASKPMFKSPVIVASQLGPTGSAIGAASLPFQNLCLPNFSSNAEIITRR